MDENSRRRFVKAACTMMMGMLPMHRVVARPPSNRLVAIALLDTRVEAENREFRQQLLQAFGRNFPIDWGLGIENIPFATQSDAAALSLALNAAPFDLCLTVGEHATKAAAAIFRSRPIIFHLTVDPVLDGIVAGMQSPERNLTGFTSFSPTHRKRWEILFEAFPDVERLTVLVGDNWPHRASVEADALKVPGRRIEIAGIDVFRPILKQLDASTRHRHLAIDVPHTGLTSRNPFMVIDYINALRVPSIYDGTHYVRWGGLASYEADPLPEVDMIMDYMKLVLNDVPPRLIPVRSPSSFTLALNLKTAAQSGLTIGKRLIKRANVIVNGSDRPGPESPRT